MITYFQRALVVSCTFLGACACGPLGDAGVCLGTKIADAAEGLRTSPNSELIMSYSPSLFSKPAYTVGLGKMVWCPNPPCYKNEGGLTVAVEHGNSGSTTYHVRSVAVPAHLFIEKKDGSPTQVVLRKNKDTIQVVELR